MSAFTIVQPRGFGTAEMPIFEATSVYTAEPRVDAWAGASEVCFPAMDVDALFEAWGKKHLMVVQKPTDMDFGRTFVVSDPDGHRIRIYRLFEERK
jgi:hypothetical protein